MHTFSIQKAIQFAWDTFRKNILFFLALSLLVLGISFLSGLFDPSEPYVQADTSRILLSLVLSVVSIILGVWVIQIGLDAVDIKRLSFSNIVPAWEVLWKFILTNALVSLILIVPVVILAYLIIIFFLGSIFGSVGFFDPSSSFSISTLALLILFLIFIITYAGTRLMFASYFVVDQKRGPIQSLRDSWRISRGVVWKLIGLVFVLSVINLAGILAVFVGLLVTFPISLVSIAYVYRALSGSGDSVPTPTGELVEPVPTPIIG